MDLVSGCLSFTCGSFTLTMWYGLVRTRTRRVYDTVDIVYIIYKHTHLIIIEGSLKVKLPTIWTDGKAEVGRVREEKVIKKKIREEKSQKKEDAGARKGRKVAIHCVFPMFCGSGSLKRRDRKAHVRPSRSAVNEPGRSKMKHTVGLVTNLLSSPPHCKGLRRSQVSGIHFSKHHKSANIFDLLSRTVPLMPRYKHTHIYIYIYTDTVFWPWHKNDLYCTL